MCTVVLRLAPGGFSLLGIRDEFAGRPWRPPGMHWPDLPLIGGLDEQAGGTWLAVHQERRRVACVLNGRGEPAPLATRRSRGDLPLRAALSGEADGLELASYDPFHLVCADAGSAWLLSWDGTRAATSGLAAGTHVLTNAGHVYPGASPDEKGGYFGPRFESADDWRELSGGDGLAPDDPRAIVVRRELPDGRLWGTSSLSMVALDGERLRYDFRAVAGEWERVPLMPRSTVR